MKINIPKNTRPAWITISALEYVITLGAIANVGTAGYQLGKQCICNYAREITAQPLIWAFLVGLIHIGGTIALILRYRNIRTPDDDNALPKTFRHRLPLFISRELTPSQYSEPPGIEEIEESYLFLFFSWCTSTGTVIHILYGTMVLSSLLSISVEDALAMAGRYLASVVCCRIVLVYELAGLRQAKVDQFRRKIGGPYSPSRGQKRTVAGG
ncbi:hypothetical protein BBP40_009260 [Aspergillus hancockii]|nr:hypothetical protein BBP40_009260 [Aspergillus hancockii]